MFSTNYDLLVYWAIMCEEDPNDFRDFFWDPSLIFDSADVEVWGRPTVVHFLHGGVHLAVVHRRVAARLRERVRLAEGAAGAREELPVAGGTRGPGLAER